LVRHDLFSLSSGASNSASASPQLIKRRTNKLFAPGYFYRWVYTDVTRRKAHPEEVAEMAPNRALILALLCCAWSQAQTTSAIYTFQGGADGQSPEAALIADSQGNLYGTTAYGGGGACRSAYYSGCGTVFQLVPPSSPSGAWTENVLYRFQDASDGAFPGGLLLDHAGNLVGTAAAGGVGSCIVGVNGCGTVFKLTRPDAPGGSWTLSVLYEFRGSQDGLVPTGLVQDHAGILFGVTVDGGPAPCQCGTSFKLTPSGTEGPWTKSVLYAFRGVPPGQAIGDAASPISLAFDAEGNLFGASVYGGFCQNFEGGSCFGTVFELSPPDDSDGSWKETVVHRFGPNIQNPVSGVVVDKTGLIYGTTYTEVFSLVPGNSLPLHVFSGSNEARGYLPYGGVVLDADGNLYGTTIGGGQTSHGVAYRLNRPTKPGLHWTETVLHSFAGSPDGDGPDAPLLLHQGALYGTTLRGGSQGCQSFGSVGCGTVFRIVN
jgi:hypothetical protein